MAELPNPYKKYGAIQWHSYGKKLSFTRHVDFLTRWIKERNALQLSAGDGLIMSKLGIKGIDSNPYAYVLSRRHGARVKYSKSDKLPYESGTFDSALISDSLASYRNLYRALSETRRVINKYLYIATGIGPVKQKPAGIYHAWSTPQSLVKEVKRYGFKLAEDPIYKGRQGRYYFKFEKV